VWLNGGKDSRTRIAFVFGFIHGFAFAGILRENGLPARVLAWSLLSFNVGQLSVVVVLATVLTALQIRNEARRRQLVFVGSAVVLVAGAFWFFQCVFFPGAS
jgi:hypothetical protein